MVPGATYLEPLGQVVCKKTLEDPPAITSGLRLDDVSWYIHVPKIIQRVILKAWVCPYAVAFFGCFPSRVRVPSLLDLIQGRTDREKRYPWIILNQWTFLRPSLRKKDRWRLDFRHCSTSGWYWRLESSTWTAKTSSGAFSRCGSKHGWYGWIMMSQNLQGHGNCGMNQSILVALGGFILNLPQKLLDWGPLALLTSGPFLLETPKNPPNCLISMIDRMSASYFCCSTTLGWLFLILSENYETQEADSIIITIPYHWYRIIDTFMSPGTTPSILEDSCHPCQTASSPCGFLLRWASLLRWCWNRAKKESWRGM